MHFCRRRGNCQGVPLRLYGVDVPLEQSVRFLGVELDRKLTYKHHLKSLRLKCMKALNLLKCVARTSYGADRATLLLLYRSLIRSKLDYACIIYNSACASHKRILDTVHHTALRVVTGAFRTSPISSILADAHEPPLSRRRDLLSMRYACKLRQFPIIQLTHTSFLDTCLPCLKAMLQCEPSPSVSGFGRYYRRQTSRRGILLGLHIRDCHPGSLRHRLLTCLFLTCKKVSSFPLSSALRLSNS